MKLTIIFSFYIFFQLAFGQYSEVDTLVSKYPKSFQSTYHLAERIASDFKNDEYRIRAVYFWVANNIRYDFDEAASEKGHFDPISYHSLSDYRIKNKIRAIRYANQCLKKRKAVCEGYSYIIKQVLDFLTIQSEIVYGTTKQYVKEIGKLNNEKSHSWNVVKVNNTWKLIDATWSTGNLVDRPDIFNFSDNYYFTDPNLMILTHYPKKKKWQLLTNPISKRVFDEMPVFSDNYFKSDLRLSKDIKGYFYVTPKEYLILRFDSVDKGAKYYYQFNNELTYKPLKIKKAANYYYAKIKTPLKNQSELTIFENYGLFKFKILYSQK